MTLYDDVLMAKVKQALRDEKPDSAEGYVNIIRDKYREYCKEKFSEEIKEFERRCLLGREVKYYIWYDTNVEKWKKEFESLLVEQEFLDYLEFEGFSVSVAKQERSESWISDGKGNITVEYTSGCIATVRW